MHDCGWRKLHVWIEGEAGWRINGVLCLASGLELLQNVRVSGKEGSVSFEDGHMA